MTPPRFLMDGKGGLAPETPDAKAALASWKGRFVLLATTPDLLCMVRTPAVGGKVAAPKVVLAGDAAGFPISDLIAFLNQSRWTGAMRVFGAGAERSISLKDGEIRSATSDDPADRLGEIMLRLGYVKRVQLDEALKDTPPSKVGRALVERGNLQAHELYKCVQHQVSEVFYAMVLCKEGTFALVEHEPEDKSAMSLQLSTQSLLMDSIRRIDEMAHFRHRIPHGRMYVVGKRGSDGKLEEEEERVLGLISGTHTVVELGQATKLSEFDVTKVIFRLLEGGYAALSDEPVTGDVAVLPNTGPRTTTAERLAVPLPATPVHVVRTFNDIFTEILNEVEKQGMGREFLAAANAALAGNALSPSPVLTGLSFQPDGRLAEAQVVQRYEATREKLTPDPVAALRQALSDVMFFLLFQAGELLESRADEDLARRVKEMLATLGE